MGSKAEQARKMRAVRALLGLAPERYYSPERIASIAGVSAEQVETELHALVVSDKPKDKELGRTYLGTARTLTGRRAAMRVAAARHEFDPSERRSAMRTEAVCATCGLPERSSQHV